MAVHRISRLALERGAFPHELSSVAVSTTVTMCPWRCFDRSVRFRQWRRRWKPRWSSSSATTGPSGLTCAEPVDQPGDQACRDPADSKRRQGCRHACGDIALPKVGRLFWILSWLTTPDSPFLRHSSRAISMPDPSNSVTGNHSDCCATIDVPRRFHRVLLDHL